MTGVIERKCAESLRTSGRCSLCSWDRLSCRDQRENSELERRVRYDGSIWMGKSTRLGKSCSLYMQTFIIQPHVQSTNEDLDEFGGEGTIAGRAADTVAAVLKKRGDSSQKFTYKNSCPMQWPGDELISLPKLRDLSLGAGCIRPRNLKAWMVKMPSLKHFRLESSRLGSEYAYHGWLDVFDAIRNHSKGMQVHFDQIIANDVAEIFLYYHTDDFERALEQKESEDPWEDIDRCLALYLTGRSSTIRV